MLVNNRVSLGFTKLPDDALVGFALNIEAGLSGNPAFPTPYVPVATVAVQRQAFASAITEARFGGPMQTAAKNDKRVILLGSLRQDASYVQMVAGTNLTALLSSGYLATNTNRVQVPLPRASIATLNNGFSGMLILNIQPLVNARAFEVETKNGADWMSAGIFAYGRGIVLPDLIPGQSYSVRVRAVGGSTGYSDWSDPASRIVT